MSDISNNFKQENRQDFDPFEKQQPNQPIGDLSKQRFSSSPLRVSNPFPPNEVGRKISGIKGRNKRFYNKTELLI